MTGRYGIMIAVCFISAICFSQSDSIQSLEERAKKNNPDAINRLIEILSSDEDSSNRAAAVRSLGNAKAEAANDQLLESLQSDDDTVRQEIIISLGKLGLEENADKIISIWENKKEKDEIRIKVLESLGYFGPDKGIKILISGIESTDSRFRKAAINSLGNTQSPEAAAALVKLLYKDKDKTNTLAAESLARLRIKNSYPEIVNFLKIRLYNYDFDRTFLILSELLGSEKYEKAQEVLAKAYLLSSKYGPHEMKVSLQKSLKDMSINSSYCLVNVNNLNLRKEPNTRADVIATLMKNNFATVLERSKIKHTIDKNQDYWYKIKTEKGDTGWLFGAYIIRLDHAEFASEK